MKRDKSEPIIIAVSGGSGSGKTTLAKHLSRLLTKTSEPLPILGQDSYYIDQSSRFDRDGGQVNFDHPSALEFSLLIDHLKMLKSGREVAVPIYEFSTHRRVAETELFPAQEIVIVEGTLLLSQPALVELVDEAIFLKVPESLRFQRRLKRDTEERGRSEAGVREQFFNQVKPMHDLFVEPSISAADIIIQEQEVLLISEMGSKIRPQIIDALNKKSFRT